MTESQNGGGGFYRLKPPYTKAFTLAEVLITLGIIGVVAAMILPTLIQKHRKSVVETGLKKFYTTMNQAIQLSVNDNGETKYWEFATNDTPENIKEWYKKYLMNYIKDLKTGIKNNHFTIYFADGSGALIEYFGHDWYYCLEAKSLSENLPSARGKKCFRFGLYPDYNKVCGATSYSAKNFQNKGIEPYVNCRIQNEDGTISDTTEKDLYKKGYYSKIIQLNGWKIPDDYPLKF